MIIKKAVDIALALEASKLDNHEISGTPTTRRSSTENVNLISKSQKKANKQSSQSDSRNNSGKNHSNIRSHSKSRIDYH